MTNLRNLLVFVLVAAAPCGCGPNVAHQRIALGTGGWAVIEPTVQLRCLDVGVLAHGDPRLTRAGLLPWTLVRRAPERYSDLARTPPPIPSNVHHDAKLWRLLASEAGPRDLWWNVAR